MRLRSNRDLPAVLVTAVLVTSAALLLLTAVPAAAQDDGGGEAEAPRFEVTLSGFYAFDGYTQNNFFLGRDAPGVVSDGDDYGIQLFRLQPVISYGDNLRAVVRVDMAQGIWGVDNEDRDVGEPGFSPIFNNKDTNFLIHVDQAYVEATVPKLGGATFRLGRMKNQLGNRLVLDQDGDGVQVDVPLRDGWSLTLDWTKMFEGLDGLTDENFAGAPDGRDADLVFVDLHGSAGAFQVSPHLAYYRDRGDADGRTYVPNELDYFKPRFQPNLSEATVLGLSFDGKVGSVALTGEANWLTGSDDVLNADSGPAQLLDVNDGDLEGYVLYADARLPLGPGTLGGVLGVGSGDDDPMSGKGNLTKVRTNGFFYVTEVWEDSVMPDEEGITPQGLGSPASRGYREFENSTLLQLNYTWKPAADWTVFLSGTVIRATEELRPWSDLNGNGVIEPGELGAATADDLGEEIDFKIDWQVMPHLTWTLRGGYFFTGEAAGYLINGTDAFLDDAWELRTTVRFGFSGLKLLTADAD